MFLLAGLPYLASADSMQCGTTNVCGVLTLQSGLGSGVYSGKPGVHGLWPETGSYGTSSCVAPSASKADAMKIYSCYDTGESDQINFENHEWEKHGWCAGVKDVDDFFTQICGLAAKPVSIMAAMNETTLDAMKTAVESAGYEIFSVDAHNAQLQLSACLATDGQWKLAAVADFHTACGGSAPGPTPPLPPVPTPTPSPPGPMPTPSPPGPSPGGMCEQNMPGPHCTADSQCTGLNGCVRCTKRGTCTDIPLTFNQTGAL
jgi:hypothetical protein